MPKFSQATATDLGAVLIGAGFTLVMWAQYDTRAAFTLLVALVWVGGLLRWRTSSPAASARRPGAPDA